MSDTMDSREPVTADRITGQQEAWDAYLTSWDHEKTATPERTAFSAGWEAAEQAIHELEARGGNANDIRGPRRASGAREAALPRGSSVWIVVGSDGPMAVHGDEASAYEDLDLRTGRGARPDLEHRYHVEKWGVQRSLAADTPSVNPSGSTVGPRTSGSSDPAREPGIDVERLRPVLDEALTPYLTQLGASSALSRTVVAGVTARVAARLASAEDQSTLRV